MIYRPQSGTSSWRRWTERFSEFACEVVRIPVDVIVATNTPADLAAKNATPPTELTGKFGSPGWARTSDFLINSQALYRLSYRGVTG